MSKNTRFWVNVGLITAVHAVVIIGLVRWSSASKPVQQSVVWLNGGAGTGPAEAPAPSAPPPKPAKIPTPIPAATAEREDEPEEDRPTLTAARSEIEMPSANPTPTPTATPRPKPVTTATPMVKTPPKPKPKKPKPTPTPTVTPKPAKKIVLAKASPKPSPKAKPSPTPDEEAKAKEMEEQIKMAKAVLDGSEMHESEPTPEETPRKAEAAHGTAGKSAASGGGGRAGGGGGESQFGWYGSMLHDRFYSEWVQPTSDLSTSAKLSTVVRIRIEKDGHVSKFEIVKPSGDNTVDESVRAVAKQVTKVDPLPNGLGSGDHYDVKINFELNTE